MGEGGPQLREGGSQMSDMRGNETFGDRETGTSATGGILDSDDVLELVWEVDAPSTSLAAKMLSADTVESHVALRKMTRFASDELLLEQELDPSDGPRVDVAPAKQPFFLVKLPNTPEHVSQNTARKEDLQQDIETRADGKVASGKLADLLDEARALASTADAIEGRSRSALYVAVERAYDVAIAAELVPDELAQLLQSAKITLQERAPTMAIVKLVFGKEYDKSRLSEYATALSHAKRIGLGPGRLAKYLKLAPGGLKRIVAEERELRRQKTGAPKAAKVVPSAVVLQRLRTMPLQPLDAMASEGDEFSLLLVRRLPDGTAALVGEVPRDITILERAARRLADIAD